MAYITYISKDFTGDAEEMLHRARVAMDQYREEGFDLTVRQIYYYFIANDLFPNDRRYKKTGSKWIRDPNGSKNAFPNYKWLGALISDGRRAGIIDWDMIKDRTRKVEENPHWGSPREILSACAGQFRADLWAAQPYAPRVWIEKDALKGILEKPCGKLDVPYFSCRGYTSDSSIWAAAQEMAREVRDHRTPVVIYLGDHDPSGCQMTEDVINRLGLFGGPDVRKKLIVARIALTMDQVDEYQPPPNYAKTTDSRYAAYVEEHDTEECYELDALEPKVLVNLVKESICDFMDKNLWDTAMDVQTQGRRELQLLCDNYQTSVDAAKEAEADDTDDAHDL